MKYLQPANLSQNKTCEIMKYLRVETADAAIRFLTAVVGPKQSLSKRVNSAENMHTRHVT
jgi:ribosomal protein L22